MVCAILDAMGTISLKDLTLAAIDLVYPATCQICHVKLKFSNKDFLCQECLSQIIYAQPLPFMSYGQKFHFNKVWSACIYEGVIKECIHLLKYKKKLCLSKFLSNLLCDFTSKYVGIKRFDLIAAVPLNRATLQERGFNQSYILAKALSDKFNMPVCNALKKIKPTLSQSTLTKQQRQLNIKDGFCLNKCNIKDKSLLLVDDVFTTGSTVNECSKALIEAGAKKLKS